MKSPVKNEEVHELLYEALETAMGRVQVTPSLRRE
jgi:hypothetical protein